ncbi:MAG: hypothetical protein SPF63_08040 [Candidatus Cryptobacteroides sp.]|nr:hypothetical protein [Candidatus Cryptobacteroides sp.]
MENNRRENFEDLLKTVADLKSRLDELERRIDEYRSAFGDSLKMPLPEEIPFEQEDFLGDMSELVADGDEIRINADEPEAAGPGTVSGPETSPESGTASEPEAEPETEAAPETEAEPEPDAEPEPAAEPEAAAEPESAAEPEAEPLQEEDDEPFSLFGEMFGAAPARKSSRSRTLNEANASRASGAVIDLQTDRPAWYVDMPGPEVKDVRSAISLNDRVMFIANLFREDSMLFQDVVNHINGMSDLHKAVAYLQSTFPEWDMGSDAVYRFMMAVRRKIR